MRQICGQVNGFKKMWSGVLWAINLGASVLRWKREEVVMEDGFFSVWCWCVRDGINLEVKYKK